MRTIDYNYIFLFYDINEKRVNKVFKICKKYLCHYQNSVFRGSITPSNQIKLQNELKKIIDSAEDTVTIIKVLNENSFSENTIGYQKSNSTDLII